MQGSKTISYKGSGELTEVLEVDDGKVLQCNCWGRQMRAGCPPGCRNTKQPLVYRRVWLDTAVQLTCKRSVHTVSSSGNDQKESVQEVEACKDDGVERGRLAGVKMDNNTKTKVLLVDDPGLPELLAPAPFYCPKSQLNTPIEFTTVPDNDGAQIP